MSRLNVRARIPSLGKKTRALNQAVSGTGSSWRNNVAELVPGNATSRCAVAWSAHGSALIEYEYTPTSGTCLTTSAKSPVSLSLVGNGGRGLDASGFGSSA